MPHVSSPTGSSIISSQPLVLKMSTNSSCLAKAQRAAESWCCCGSIPGWCLLQASGKTGKHENLSCCCSFLSTGSIWGQLLAFGAVQSHLYAALGTAWGGPGAAGSCSWGGGIQGQEVQKCQGREEWGWKEKLFSRELQEGSACDRHRSRGQERRSCLQD